MQLVNFYELTNLNMVERTKKTKKEPLSANSNRLPKKLELSVLPLQNSTLFPHTVIPLAVERERSVKAVESALSTEDKLIACVRVKTENVNGDDAKLSDLFEVGTVVNVKRMMRTEGIVQLVVQGIERFRIVEWSQEKPFLKARVEVLPDLKIGDNDEVEALKRNLQNLIREALAMLPQIPPEIRMAVMSQRDPAQLSYFLSSVLDLGKESEQKILEANTVDELLALSYAALSKEVEIMNIRTKIATEAQTEMDKAQRDYVLRQQMKAIQKELGEDDGERAEANQLRERMDQADLPEDVKEEVKRELNRMEQLPQSASDFHVIRTYLEYVLELPWKKSSEEKLELEEARKILDEDHYGLEDVKERILEFLAVIKLRPDSRSPIMLLVGPPGVGKTSLGRSIARALGREFERFSLGGMRDEAELRGHRRTYIGAMPGRIIQGLRRAGVNNPVLMLDEVDKLGNDYRGDPSSALLEILDPQQNDTFRDHYIDLPFDLSKAFFIATANQLAPIPAPLRDRMEIISLAGYSDQEKLNIAVRYLAPRQIEESGLKSNQVEISEDVINLLISKYTREAGVRQLEREIGNLARKVALKVAQDDEEKVKISVGDVKDYLGGPRFYPEQARTDLPTGVATGMAWTEMGGQVLFIEAVALPESKGLTLTGQLGDVMKESAMTARSYLWSNASELKIEAAAIKENGLHLHVPAGAIPKDGPSAGVTMVSAIASLYTRRKVRSDTAMTGEITLSGLVFPVGGIKEKVLAAHRAGIKRIIMPQKNEASVEEIPEDVRRELDIILALKIDDVLKAALENDSIDQSAKNYRISNAETNHDSSNEALIAKND